MQLRSKLFIASLNKTVFICVAVILTDNLCYVFYLIKLNVDIKKNHGPKLRSSQKLSIYDWDLNSIAAHNFNKISLLIAYNLTHKYDKYVCLKHILIQVQPLVMTVYKKLNTILCNVIIPPTINSEVFVLIANRISLV